MIDGSFSERSKRGQTAKVYYLENAEARLEWARSVGPDCMLCGNQPATETHEIERRSHAPRGWAKACNYLRVCQKCHSGPLATMPHDMQLAYKLWRDPNHFDLNEWNLMANRRVELGAIVQKLLVLWVENKIV